ncbi:MAG: hypothetical protein ACSLE4_11955 [Methyloceanibacter sp.]|uniref:hypothetical protein n=1 Tax=Methyloceanibacter sp. TaxID=1965321 RepID=UPI003EE2DE72
MRAVLIASLSLMVALGSPARAEDDAEDEGFQYPETAVILALQSAIRTDDKDWFVANMHFPVRYFGETKQTIRSKEWFLRHYDTIIGPKLKANMLAQDPEHYFKNYQGLMVGDGGRNIWFADFGDGNGVKYEIITINNSD